MILTVTRRTFLAGVAAAALFAPAIARAAEEAEIIYSGGPVITVDDANPRAEAVAVRAGRILAVGTTEAVMKLKGANTRMVDLGGRALLPGFVDSHGHIMLGGIQAVSANMLPPPDGPNDSVATLLATLRDWAANNADVVKQVNLILGFGYDNSQLKELRHPTREELDEVSRDVPVMIVHQSGHLAVFNSKALEIVGYTAETPNPQGGVIQRKQGSNEPNGVLEETAFMSVAPALLANIGPLGMKALTVAGADLWASFGYTTVQEGRSTPGTSGVMKAVADEGKFKVDVVTYPDVLMDREFIKANASREYKNRFRIAGAKLTIDGSPQGFTAWRDRPYYRPVGNYPPGYLGYAAATPEQTIDSVDWAYAQGLQIITHSNGEAASDLLIASVRAAQARHGRMDTRPVLIHGQFQREDQVDSFVELGVVPSIFPMHTFYWGDWHRDHTVGPVNAENISPTGWYHQRGARFTSHHDAPVAFPDSMRVLSATVTRRTRSGDILGPHQRVSVDVALKAMTLWAAYQIFEEADKGSIEPGKRADFVILTQDPTAIDPETLDQIMIAETIKDGVTVYAASPESLKKTQSGSREEHPVSKFLAAMAVDRDLRSLPEKRQTPMIRKILSNSPHNRACVSAVLADLTEAMLSKG
jgi:predicted amidohydrolase YtcJ